MRAASRPGCCASSRRLNGSPESSSFRPGPTNPYPWTASAGSQMDAPTWADLQTHRQSPHIGSLLQRSQSPAEPFHSRPWPYPSLASALSSQGPPGSSADSRLRRRSKPCDFPRFSLPFQDCFPVPILTPTQRTKPLRSKSPPHPAPEPSQHADPLPLPPL
jgi:hypothetical protein